MTKIINVRPEEPQEESDEMKLGRKAYQEGKNELANPYCFSSEHWSWMEWNDGWEMERFASLHGES